MHWQRWDVRAKSTPRSRLRRNKIRQVARLTMAMTSTRTFRVALTGDFYNQAGEMPFKEMGLTVFDGDPNVEYFPFAEHRPQIGADQVKDANAVVVLAPAVTSESLT